MILFEYLSEYFCDGIQYEDAVQLALAIYSAADILPVELFPDELTMEGVAYSFATLASGGKVLNYCVDKSVLFGAHYHKFTDKGHWIEVLASIFKNRTEVDFNRVNRLFAQSPNMGTDS